MPAVLTSRWEASDGSQAQLFVNYTREEQGFCVRGGSAVMLLERSDGMEPLPLQPDSSGRVACRMKPLSVIMIQ